MPKKPETKSRAERTVAAPHKPAAANAPSAASSPSAARAPRTTHTPRSLRAAATAEKKSSKKPAAKAGLHPRNKHTGRYDFEALIACSPDLAPFVSLNAYQNESIDFADPNAVRALNRALLFLHYGITRWDFPTQYLCPPIPGRADYVHHLADLLALSNGNSIPYGEAISVLDIGTGANCIYPLIGHSAYGWRFVGTDIDRTALKAAQVTIDANSSHRNAIELRRQNTRDLSFHGVLQADELFDLVMSNPPFHASMDEARIGSARKWQNLGKTAASTSKDRHATELTPDPVLNFSGQSLELCCAGGEEGFISRMIAESVSIQNSVLWFSALVSKATSLPAIYRALKKAGVQNSRTIEMSQGQKQSRIVAWTFLTERQQQAWRNMRRAEATRD